MRITMVKLLALVGTGCVLLGVTLAAETNKRHRQPSPREQQSVRNKRGLLSALFGGGAPETSEQQAVDVPVATSAATEVLPIYGDPAQPPLHMLYGHATGLPGPYPPYPVMFIPGPPSVNDGTRPGPYLPMVAYGGDGSSVQFHPAPVDSNYLPAVPAQMPPVQQVPSGEVTTTGGKQPPADDDQPLDVSKSAYLQKLNLTPADEAELKRLSKQLGVTDFEHLPPFEDVMALLGTTTSAETIKAIKEYASTPDGLELIRDYVLSYQPAKRISLGKQPYTDANGLEETSQEPMGTTIMPSATSDDPGFFARQLRRLKSLLTFGYFGGDEVDTPDAMPLETPNTEAEVTHLTPVEVTSEATPFLVRNEFPAFEVRDGAVRGVPVAHYLIPVRALPPQALSYAPDHRYASAIPFPLALHYPPESQYPNPFSMRAEQGVPSALDELTVTTTTRNEPTRRESTVAPQRVAPPTLPTGVLHTFERVDLEPADRSTTTTTASAPMGDPETADTTAGTVDAGAHQRSTLGPIVVEPELLDPTELSTNTLDEQ